MTQGQSIETPHKLRGIDAAMRMQLAIAGPILRRQSFARYFHFDLPTPVLRFASGPLLVDVEQDHSQLVEQ